MKHWCTSTYLDMTLNKSLMYKYKCEKTNNKLNNQNALPQNQDYGYRDNAII